ncbi:hypothetical protein E2C01_035600 [Portunus trituberculatus]|uniref:Uncharacterized protein n=1 Tax=Portunus trituberculatus TaxID=210409 RepID=A0A5B7FA71_PORTR|nr:hypothetical protein [Portunus trituberculatus]
MKGKMNDLTSSSQKQVTSAQQGLSGAERTGGGGRAGCWQSQDKGLKQHRRNKSRRSRGGNDTHFKANEMEIKASERTMSTVQAKESHTLQEEAGRLERAQEELSGKVQAMEVGLVGMYEEMDSSR